MSIIFTSVKISIICMIGLNILYIYLLNGIIIKDEECSSDSLEISHLLNLELILLFALLIRMFFEVFTRKYDEINWEDDLFEILIENQDRYNIMNTFYLIQIVFASIGYLSGKSILNYINYPDNNCKLLDEFIGIGFCPFLLISIFNYYKIATGFILAIAACLILAIGAIISPANMFYYIDELLEKRLNTSKIRDKIFIGNIPECCVCYEENCWIIACGHLICKSCIPKMIGLKCPLCKSNIILIQSYDSYKKNKK